jgi:hypothetical protein
MANWEKQLLGNRNKYETILPHHNSPGVVSGSAEGQERPENQ